MTREVKIGNKIIGGGHPILIQSMTNTKTADVAATVNQILALEKAGCDIVRSTVNDADAAAAIPYIKEKINIPLVADIHFDYKMALAAIEGGVDKVRINPGNIGGSDRVRQVIEAASKKDVAIRVGVNGGSLEKELVERYGGVTPEGLVESALKQVKMIEDFGYENIVISIKSSNVPLSIAAHRLLVKETDYPLHIGITETGTLYYGSIKSAVGLGILLNDGIGDTMRVSLTGDPVEEIKAAKAILKSLGLRKDGIELISCPTCGRTNIDLIGLANKVEEMIEEFPLNIKVAVMGCIVNGPGEAKEADIGIAGGNGEGVLIKKGQIIKKLPESELLNALKEELVNWKDQT